MEGSRVDPNKAILLVEDNDADAMSVKRAFRESGLANPVVRVERGEAALEFLNRTGNFADRSPALNPALVLLDLNMPGMDGLEVLQAIRANPKFSRIPVIVLTTSTHDRDVEACYQQGANSYVQKPVDFDRLMVAVKRMKDYWFELVILPRQEEV